MSDPITVADLAAELGTTTACVAAHAHALIDQAGAADVIDGARDGAAVLTGTAADIIREQRAEAAR